METASPFALVTSSVLIRGALTAIHRISKPTPAFQAEPFATFAEADAWIAAKRGVPTPALRRLHEACLVELAASRAAAAR